MTAAPKTSPAASPLEASLEQGASAKRGQLAGVLNSPLEGVIANLEIGLLTPDPYQPRKTFNETSLQELSQSIEHHGVLENLIVRPAQGPGTQGKYWVVAGQRRLLAAQRCTPPIRLLPCAIRAYTNHQALMIGLVENIHREDITDLEKAEALVRLRTMTEQTWEEIANMVKLSVGYVKRIAGLLTLQDSVKTLVQEGKIRGREAIALRSIPGKMQEEMAERVVAEGLKAEDIREWAAENLAPSRSRPNVTPPPPVLFPAPVIDEEDDRVREEPAGYDAKSAAAGERPEADTPPSEVDPLQAAFNRAQGTSAPEAELLSRPVTIVSGRTKSRGPEGQIVSAIRQYAGVITQIDEWVESRDWSPSRVSERQAEEIAALASRVSLLSQHLAGITRGLRKEEDEGAERLKNAALPF